MRARIEALLQAVHEDELFAPVDIQRQEQLVEQIAAALPEPARTLIVELADNHARHVWLQQEGRITWASLAVGRRLRAPTRHDASLSALRRLHRRAAARQPARGLHRRRAAWTRAHAAHGARDELLGEHVHPAGRIGGTDVRMRIFTPTQEMPMAGHPTIGSTFALAIRASRPGRARFVFGLNVGPTPVDLEWEGDVLRFAWMTQLPPSSGRSTAARRWRRAGSHAHDLAPDLPVQDVSCGFPSLSCRCATRDRRSGGQRRRGFRR